MNQYEGFLQEFPGFRRDALLTEYLPTLKALPNAAVTRVVCGGCGDFKVIVNQPASDHGDWAGEGPRQLQGELLEALVPTPLARSVRRRVAYGPPGGAERRRSFGSF